MRFEKPLEKERVLLTVRNAVEKTILLKEKNILLEETKAKQKLGKVTNIDLYRAEIQALQAENNVVNAQTMISSLVEQFKLLLGEDIENIQTVSKVDVDLQDIEYKSAVETALKNRIDLEEAKDRIEDAKLNLKLARDNRLPRVDLQISYGAFGNGPSFGKSLKLSDPTLRVGLVLGGQVTQYQNKASVDRAELDIKKAERNLEQKKQNITQEVREAVIDLKQKKTAIVLQEKSVGQAEKQLEFAQIRFTRGLSDNLTIIEAEESLSRTRTSHISALINYIIAKTRLKMVTGTMNVGPGIPKSNWEY